MNRRWPGPLASISTQLSFTPQRVMAFALAASLGAAYLPPEAVAQTQAQLVPDMINALGVPYSPAVEHALQESDRKQMESRYGIPHERAIPFWERQRNKGSEDSQQNAPGSAPLSPSSLSNPFNSNSGAPSFGEIDESDLESKADELCAVGNTQKNARDIELCKRLRPQTVLMQPQNGVLRQWPAQLSSPARSVPDATPENNTRQAPAKNLPTVRIGGYIPAAIEKPAVLINRQGKEVMQTGIYKQVSRFSNGLASVLVTPLELPTEEASASAPKTSQNMPATPAASSNSILDFSENGPDNANPTLVASTQDSLPDTAASGLEKNENENETTQPELETLKPLFGYIDRNGKLVVSPRFEMAGDFKPISKSQATRLYARAKWENPDKRLPQWGYIDPQGDIVIENRFAWAGDFSEGLAIVSLPMDNSAAIIAGKADEAVAHQYGFIDPQGTVVIAPQYDEAEPFSDGLAKVWSAQMSNSQLIKLSLNKAVPEDAAQPNLNAHGWPQYRFITPQGQTAFEPAYDWVSSFDNGFARVGYLGDARDIRTRSTTPEAFGYISKQGELLIPIAFENAWPFVGVEVKTIKKPPAPLSKMSYAQRARWKRMEASGQNITTSRQILALVKQNGKYGYIGPSGNFAFPNRFDWAEEFHENLAAVRVGEQYGFINPNGQMAIPARYDWVGNFSQGLAAVAHQTSEGLSYGFIDRSGKTVIPERYHWVTSFSDGVAQVRE